MYVYKKDAEKLIGKTVVGLVNELRRKGDFLHGLLKQDDWSFVIKAHALLEAAITQLLIANLENEKLESFIQRLSLGGQFGKLRLCEQLGLLSDAQRKFTRWFSEFRNPLVHRLENVTFTFAKHVKRFQKDEARTWVESIVWFSKDDLKTQADWKKIAIAAPKYALFMGLYLIIGECIIQSHGSKAKKAIHATSDRTMKSLFPARKGVYKSEYLARCKEIIDGFANNDQTALATKPSQPPANRRRSGRERSSEK